MDEKQGITRRKFVGITGAGLGAIALGSGSLSLLGCSSDNNASSEQKEEPISFAPGSYSTSTTGMEGEFEVDCTCTDTKIEEIDVGDNSETLMVGAAALNILKQRIVDFQSLGVDAVSGATISSFAMIRAAEQLAEDAGADVDALKKVPVTIDTYEGKKTDADIIIVGGGLAGMTAAISAAENGANVILLEEKEFTAGNSALSTGIMLLGGTSIQAALGIEDDTESFYEWILSNSGNKKDPDQARIIADNSQKLVDWFEKMGIKFNEELVSKTDGSSVNRTHYLYPNVGTALQVLADRVKELGVDVRYSTKGQSLIVEDGKVTGVNATDYYGNDVAYTGKLVLLSSGGFGDSPELITKYWGDGYNNLVYGGLKGMDGTMMQAGIDAGADLTDISTPHVDATLEVNRAVTITTTLLGSCGGIIIRQSDGKRIADEAARHSDAVSTAMHDLGDEYYYEIFDGNAASFSETAAHKVDAYIKMGLTTEYESIKEMASGINVGEAALTQTLDDYNAAVRGEKTDEFGRTEFYKELAAPFYVMKVSNGVACTTGGLKVNSDMQVIDTKGNAIPNLYAIGEIAGGFLIKYVGGDSLSHSAIGGMVTGAKLAKIVA